MALALDMLSLGASGRRSYAWGVGSGLTEPHSDFWQSLGETTWLTTQAVFGGMSVTGHVRTQNHSQEKMDRMPSLPYAAGRPAPLGS